jgi:hypothetical protein
LLKYLHTSVLSSMLEKSVMLIVLDGTMDKRDFCVLDGRGDGDSARRLHAWLIVGGDLWSIILTHLVDNVDKKVDKLPIHQTF